MIPKDTLGRRLYFARVWQQRRSLKAFGEQVATREGRALPYHAATVSAWEHNRAAPPVTAFVAIAEVTGVRAEWLLLGTGEVLSSAYNTQGAA